MSRSTLRIVMVALTLMTAVIHLVLGVGMLSDPAFRTLGILFVLNAVGYSTLLWACFGKVWLLPKRRDLAHYLLMGFALITIAAWIPLGSRDLLAYATKLAEVLLIAAAFMHLRAKH